MVRVVITRRVEKVVRRKKLRTIISKAIEVLKHNPMAGRLLKGRYSLKVGSKVLGVRLRTLRISDYRVIYWYKENMVWVLLINHRKQVYEELRSTRSFL